MSIQQLTSAEYFRKLLMVFVALVIGQLIFALAVVVIIFSKSMEFIKIDFPNALEVMFGAMAVFTVACMQAGTMLYKKKMTVIKGKNSLKEKLTDYQSAATVRFALFDAPSFMAIAIAMITGNLYFLGYTAVIVMAFVYYKPGKERLKNDLELNQTECMLIDDPTAIVAEVNRNDFNG